MHLFCERCGGLVANRIVFCYNTIEIMYRKADPLETVALKPYQTVSNPSETEYVINRSRFIGRCFPVTEEAEALAILERIRKQHWDATHNCFAYRLRSGAARYSDDGEPQGTAGLPMMEVLKKRDVLDVLVISTR